MNSLAQKKHTKNKNAVLKNLTLIIFTCFFLASLTPLTIFFVSDYTRYKEKLNTRIEKRLINVSISAKKSIENFFKTTTRSLESISRLSFVTSFDSQTESDLIKTGVDLKDLLSSDIYLKKISEVSHSIEPYQQLLGFEDFYIIDSSGNIIFSLRQDEHLGSNVINGPLNRTLFSKACLQSLETGTPSYTDLEVNGPTDKEAYVYITTVIIRPNGKKPGLAVLKFKPSRLSIILDQFDRYGEETRAFIVGKDSRLRAGFIKKNGLEKYPLTIKKTLANPQIKDKRFDIFKVQGGQPFAAIISGPESFGLQGPEWYLVSETSFHTVNKLLFHYKRNAFFYLVLATCFSLGLAFFISVKTLKPLEHITEWARKTANGNILTLEGSDSSNEIKGLYKELGVVARRLKDLINYCNDIATGDFSKPFPTYNTNDTLGKSINGITDFFFNIEDKVKQITKGNYSITIAPYSKYDKFSPALSKMAEALHQMNQENFRQISTTYAQMELIKQISGEQDLFVMTKRLLSFLCSYFNAQSGVFYIAGKNNKILNLSGSHGCMRTHLPECYEPGEGLVGQALLEKKPLMISVCPDDYIRIVSGLGNSKPANLLVYPFLFRNDVIAVMEIASLHSLDTNSLDFLNKNCESISIAINSAITRALMAELLEQTIEQSNILKIQQEDLKNANIDMASQTKALKKSQARLMTREEELRDANRELEAHSRYLEKQKTDLDQKNKELLAAKSSLETKAMELELSNRHKSEFLANMSHELRTPLNSIILLSKLLSDNKGGTLGKKQTRFTSIINKSGTELLNLINEILDLSKVTSGTMRVTPSAHNLNETKKKLERLFQKKAAEKGIHFSVQLDETIPESIITDAYKLDQILSNFISNAIKFSDTGKISVHICRPGKDLDLSKSQLSHENAIEFSVKDTGIGIAKNDQTMIFDAFKQADGSITRIHSGSGLGLTIASEFTKLLAGEIQLKSTFKKGSTFSLFIPEKIIAQPPLSDNSNLDEVIIGKSKKKPAKVTGTTNVSEPYVPDDRNSISRKSKSVLLIEDDSGMLKIMQKHARNLKFKSLIAECGETGLFMAQYYKPNAIILDIGLPGIDGFGVMTRLKDNPLTRHIPVYFISGLKEKMKAMEMGAIGYLPKPVNAKNLSRVFDIINRVIEGRAKNLLVFGKNTGATSLLEGGDIDIFSENNHKKALNTIAEKNIGCIVINHDTDMGKLTPLLEKINVHPDYHHLPIVVNTVNSSNDALKEIKLNSTNEMIIKYASTPEILLDETTIFLHREDALLSDDKKSILDKIHHTQSVLENKTILLVDDDIKNVFAITGILEDAGLKVFRAENGQKALEVLDKNPEIDLVLMDIMMPVMNGYEAIKEICKRHKLKKLPIIALTAKALKGDRYKCIEAGASDYLSKPVDIDKLITLIQVWLY